MNRTHLSLLLIGALSLGGCSSGTTTSPAETSAGDEMVVTPTGNEVALDAAGSESYEQLAAELSSQTLRVDHGSFFTHEASGREGRMLIAAAEPLEVLEFDSTAAALAFADRISPDGRLLDGEMMYPSSMSTVRVYAYRQCLVIYRGDDDYVMRSLGAIAVEKTTPLVEDDALSAQASHEVLSTVTSYLDSHEMLHEHQMDLITQERATFANACLDIEGAAEFCAVVQTPGWRFTFRYGDQTVVVHADLNAARVHVRE